MSQIVVGIAYYSDYWAGFIIIEAILNHSFQILRLLTKIVLPPVI